MALFRTFTAIIVVLLAAGVALAQGLSGSWLEHEIGFLVTLNQRADGSISGTLQGNGPAMNLDNLRSEGNVATGTFMLDGELAGITVELQPDGQTMFIWLFAPDANGQPLGGVYESYVASPYQDTGQMPAQAGQSVGTPAATGGAARMIHGTWLEAYQPGPGTMIVSATAFYPNGTYEYVSYWDGFLSTWLYGTYTVESNPDGSQLVTKDPLNWAPQMCAPFGCQPLTSAPPREQTQLWFVDGNTYVTYPQVNGQTFEMYVVRQESGLQPPIAMIPQTPAQVQPGAAAGGAMPGMGAPGTGFSGTGWSDAGSSNFIQGVIYEQGDYYNPYTGEAYDLPMVADPNWNYTSPSGNDLSYNDITGTWTEMDSYGWETDLESGW